LIYNQNAGIDRNNWFTGGDKPVFVKVSSTVTQEGGRFMDILPRHSLVFRVCGLVCIVFGLLVALPVRADVGVHPILPGGSSLKPEVETPVVMQAEKVTLNVRIATEADNTVVKLNPEAYGLQFESTWFPAAAEVHADFTMKNPASETANMTVWFPLASTLETVGWELNPDEIVPHIDSFKVVVDGKAVDFIVSDLPNPKGADKPPLPWASFPVSFPAGEEVLIEVSYVLPAQPTVDDVGMTFNYILQTGAGWAGPIGKAELVVNLPYPASAETIGAMPEGGQAEGKRVRWTWDNLEPGPQDDFSIWLLLPEHWDELQAARLAVKANPEDGEAWLNLASTYRRLIFGKYQVLPGFGVTYQPLGVEAAQEALRLLPGDGRPHYELAMFYMSTLPKNPSPEELKPVLDELKLVEELIPALAPNVYDMLELFINPNPSAEWISWSADWAAETAEAALMLTPSTTSIQKLTQSSTPVPSTTPQPTPKTPTPTTVKHPEKMTGDGQSLVIIAAAGVIGLIIVGYLALKRMRKNMKRVD
jgi:hypothetical protein